MSEFSGDKLISIQYPSPPEGATYESLKADGWKGEYSFYFSSEHYPLVQKEIDKWKRVGYEVTVVRPENAEDRKAGIGYVMYREKLKK